MFGFQNPKTIFSDFKNPIFDTSLVETRRFRKIIDEKPIDEHYNVACKSYISLNTPRQVVPYRFFYVFFFFLDIKDVRQKTRVTFDRTYNTESNLPV